MSQDPDRQETVEELRATVRSVCASLGATACARRAIDAGTPGADAKAWAVLSEQVGIAGLGLPEEHGGIGGLPEMMAVSEELGATLLPVPFFSSTVLTGQVLARCNASANTMLEGISGGEMAALAALGNDGLWDSARAAFTLASDGHVSGHASTVLGVPEARWLIAATPGELVLVDLAGPGCEVVSLPTLDLTRSAGTVTLTAAPCTIVSDSPDMVLRPALDMATLVLAAEQIGGAQACLDTTVAYVKERHQFSRPIGSFQTIKHTLADALVKIEMGRSALVRAIELPKDTENLTESAAVARIWCNEAYRFVSAEAIQLHGGIGFTWEHDAHLYFRRARSDALILGTTSSWRERLARTLNWTGHSPVRRPDFRDEVPDAAVRRSGPGTEGAL
jgi:alkylation response protein AidB-like acyl-CoA dehydrogenase